MYLYHYKIRALSHDYADNVFLMYRFVPDELNLESGRDPVAVSRSLLRINRKPQKYLHPVRSICWLPGLQTTFR